ncbi:MAG: type IX secretion system membrane protein PorP/SprF [Bacteroidota bacterium]
MKVLIKYILLILLLFGLKSTQAQQSVQFSQYMFNGLALNPAYAGYKDSWTLNLSSRLQWNGFDGAPGTGTASVDGLLGESKTVGLGLLATIDKLGPQSTSSFYANYAYRMRLNADDFERLCFGIGVGVSQYKLEGSLFSPTDPGDVSIPNVNESRSTPDVRFGVYYYSPKMYLGASVFNLLSASNVVADYTHLVRQVRTLYLTGGLLIPISPVIDLRPSIMIKEDFKGPTNIDLTGYTLFNKKIGLGASYRTGVLNWKSKLQNDLQWTDAAAAMAQFYINDHFRIGYAFDFSLNSLGNYQSGTHELSLSLSLPGRKSRMLSPRYF